MTTNRIKLFAIIILAVPLLLVAAFSAAPTITAASSPDDAAATYKAKCAMCHTATASKFFDASRPDAELAEIILNGKKAEKPPNMPEFKSKGITDADAQALVTYMKSLKAPTN